MKLKWIRLLGVVLVPCWRIGWWLARWWRMQKLDSAIYSKLLPMLRVGSLRVGGAGKTPTVMALVREQLQKGKRVAVVCHDVLGKSGSPVGRKLPPFADAMQWGDEPALLAQVLRVDVWITRNRWLSWIHISQNHKYDVLICDDGLEDPRLDLAPTWLLDWGDGRNWWDLLPMGRCRSLVSDHPNVRILRVGVDIDWVSSPPQNSLGVELIQGAQIVVLCGIGDPKRFVNGLLSQCYTIQDAHFLADHSTMISEKLEQILAQTTNPIVVTTKDAVKCTPRQRENPQLYTSEALTFLSSGW